MDRDYEKHPTENIRPSSSGSDTKAKIGAKRKRLTGTPHRRHQLPEDIPWTAARCNRLLRPITSRIQILRRLSENNFADKAAARKSPARRKIVFHPGGSDGGRVSPEGVESVRSRLAAIPTLESPSKESNDPDWLPEDGKKATQKTYAGKGGKGRKVKIEEPLLPAKSSSTADFRSPFIKRVLRTDAVDSPTNVITDTPRRLTSQSRIVLDPKTHAERALRTLLEAFNKVLSTTASPQQGRKVGAGSLRDMCLHRVPQYIDFEQKFAYDEEEYDFDATEAIYVDLEKHGNGAWDGLREVTRAHAVKMIADAMDERSWPVESLDRLLDVCERNQAVAEGQQILRSWFLKSEGRASNRMARLLAWSKILDCTGFFFSTLREMLECGRLHMHEFTECPGVWQDLVKALARKSSRSNAAQFLEEYTLACVCTGSDATGGAEEWRLHDRLKRDEILQNVMVLATALCWTIDDTTSLSTKEVDCLSSHIHRMAINACQRNNDQDDEGAQSTNAPRTMLHSTEPLLTSSIVLQALNANTASDCVGLLPTEVIWHNLTTRSPLPSQSSKVQALRSARAQFVCSTAKCIAHISQASANGFIKDASSSLLSLAERSPDQVGEFLKQLAVDVAAAWANYRCDNESYTFADEIELAAFYSASAEQLAHSPGSAQKPVQFRWEATIEEWVAMTPLSEAPPQRYTYQETRDGFPILRTANAVHYTTPGTPSQAQVRSAISVVRAHAEMNNGLLFGGGLREDSQPSTTNPESEGSTHVTPAESDPMAGRAPLSTHPINGMATEALEQWTESPLQAKASRRVPDQLTEAYNIAHHQITTTRRTAETVCDDSPVMGLIKDELAPETPARPLPEPSPTQTTLAFRSRPPVAPTTSDSGGFVDRDELAMSPAKQHDDILTRIEVPEAMTEDSPPQHLNEERDELAATPARQSLPSTRQLRSARQPSAAAVDKGRRMELFDELAMTPAQRVVASPRKTKVLRRMSEQATQCAARIERDELGVTPQVTRIARSRSTKARGTKSRRKVEKVDVDVLDDCPEALTQVIEKSTNLPLRARSANARTAAKTRKGDASDDELGL